MKIIDINERINREKLYSIMTELEKLEYSVDITKDHINIYTDFKFLDGEYFTFELFYDSDTEKYTLSSGIIINSSIGDWCRKDYVKVIEDTINKIKNEPVYCIGKNKDIYYVKEQIEPYPIYIHSIMVDVKTIHEVIKYIDIFISLLNYILIETYL